jgi:hypothetical protein
VRNFLSIALVAVLCALLALTHRGRVDRQLGTALSGYREVSTRYATLQASVVESLTALTSGTSFSGSWQINGPLSEGKINIYFVDSRLPSARTWNRRFPNLAKNCSSSPGGTIVVCDLYLVDQLATKVTREDQGPAAERDKVLILEWMLAHELGHIALGHSGSHFFSSPLKSSRMPSDKTYTQEEAADDYAASILFSPKRSIALEVMFMNLANAEVREKTGTPQYGAGLLYDYEKPVRYTTACTHPAYVVRAHSLLRKAATYYQDSGLESMLRSFAVVLREDSEPCDLNGGR